MSFGFLIYDTSYDKQGTTLFFFKSTMKKKARLKRSGHTSCRAVLSSNLVDERCQVLFLVALVDLAVRSFPLYSLKLT